MAKQRFSDFIIELYSNQTDEDREKSRSRLQEQYQACDSRLTELVKDNRGTLSNTVEICSKVIGSVNDSKNRCRELKERITKCQSQLQWNRDNIRRMWLESLEHKYAHQILSEIEELRTIPREVRESLIDKKLEHATEVIVSSVRLLDRSLCNADALKDLRLELHNLQEKLYLMLLEDLRKNLHLTDFVSRNFGPNLKDVTYDDVFSNTMPPSDHSFKELLCKVSYDREYAAVLLHCVNTMKRLPDAMDFLKENCQLELVTVSQEISKLMNDIVEKTVDASPRDLPAQKQHIFLVDLLEHALVVFRKILNNYQSFFQILQNIVETNGIGDVLFQAEDIYSILQTSVEKLIGPYLDTHSSPFIASNESFNFASSQNVGDIGAFFSPQNSPGDKNSTLFSFSNSCHGMSSVRHSQEVETEGSEETVRPILVCRPNLRNITLIFNPLKDFVSEIEECLNLVNGDHCPLHAFLYDSANLFLDHVNSDINRMLKSASANLDAWNTAPVCEGPSFKSNPEREVLSCALILDSVMKELQSLMGCLPDYSNHFLRLIYYVILDYKDMYHKAFKQMFEEEQNILSVSWARDKDIRRLMKSFLNWRHLEDEGGADIVESPEEVRLRNKEESDLLIRNLRSEDETSWEIITDANKLSNLALLQENLIWFSVGLLKFIKNFNQSESGAHDAKNNGPENTVASAVSGLRKVIKEYEDFADMCLLALHLEVRARCFHHLLTFSAREICVESVFIQELDAAVKRLTSDLLQIDEVLLPVLTPKEFKYVFEGLGELVASLVILVVSNMNKINETVVRKIDRNLFIIQCCLANITMAREVSLERARLFIDLLNSTPEEILDHLVEEGPRFNEQEYASVFRLISSGASRELEYYLEKLKLIFKRSAPNAADP